MGEVMLGWCLTGHHNQCIKKISEYDCKCECHKEDK